MADIIDSSWNPNDEANTGVAPDGVQGGYAPSTVAPIIRAMRGAIKRSYDQINPTYTSTGSANAYVLTYPIAPAKYSKGIIYAFWANHTNTGAATLNINGLGAKAITSSDKNPLVASQILADTVVTVVYDGSAFRMIAASTVNPKFTGTTSLENLTVSGTTNAQAINVTTVSATGTMNIKSEGNRVLWFRDGEGKETGLIYNNSGTNNTHLRAYTPGETTYKETILQSDGQLILGASPSSASAATTKSYVDTLAGTKLSLSGGTVAGNLVVAHPSDVSNVYMRGGGSRTLFFQDGAGANQGLIQSGGTSNNLLLRAYALGNPASYKDVTLRASDGALILNHYATDANEATSKTYVDNVAEAARASAVSATNGNMAGRAYPRRSDGGALNFYWSGQGGQPTWLWGGNGNGNDMYVYNPANFNVNAVGGWTQATISNQIEGRAAAWARQEAGYRARKCGSWDQWNFTSHDQRMQNNTGENIYYTAKLTGTYANSVQLQISPDNGTYWTVCTTLGGDTNNGEYSGGCLPPGWWMRLIRGSGSYNGNVILIW
ncbi:hypothetical protein JS562_12060 [Agrobacterium sp. S2]|nr:hypothetical protein [Agrobacterium sp. S2]